MEYQMLITILVLLIIIYIIVVWIRVNLFMNRLLKDVERASLIRLGHFTAKNKIVGVDSLHLFKVFDYIKRIDLIFRYSFKDLSYKNVLLEEDLKELNSWLNIY